MPKEAEVFAFVSVVASLLNLAVSLRRQSMANNELYARTTSRRVDIKAAVEHFSK